MKRFKFYLFCILLSYNALVQADVNSFFNRIKNDPNVLYAFLKEMPKGGELHYHLAGGAYPETMLALAAKRDFCLDRETFAMTKVKERCLGVEAREVLNNQSIYDKVIRAWSMKNFVAGEESGHDHFFASFYKFFPVVFEYRPELLAEVMQRAANQNEHYLEVMVLPDNGKSSTFLTHPISENDFAKLHKELLSNKDFRANIQFTVNESKRISQTARQKLGCEQNPQQATCKLNVKFLYYVLREQPLEKLFAQAVNGFAAASQSEEIVGVNLVQPEDGLISLRDYRKQMAVFAFLHQLYPKVAIALHAGELSPTAVAPADLRFHIHDAIAIGGAQRIGHGVDIGFEDKSEETLKTMAKKQIPVEINLISNKSVLNIEGQQHPLRDYLAHGVPVVLSTDDEGILRTDLTRQYLEAVVSHHLDYQTLKRINRNALTYSFLPGKSLWADVKNNKMVDECQDKENSSCQNFLKNSQKAQLQWELEKALNQFEKQYANKN